MTREEVLELTLQVIKGKMWWETNGEVIIEVALAAADHEREACTKLFKELEQKDQHIAEVIEAAVQAEREAFPDLSSVIAWLENGCDPQEAAKELRLYAEAIKARGKA